MSNPKQICEYVDNVSEKLVENFNKIKEVPADSWQKWLGLNNTKLFLDQLTLMKLDAIKDLSCKGKDDYSFYRNKIEIIDAILEITYEMKGQ